MSDEIHHVGGNDPGYPHYVFYTQSPPKLSMSTLDKVFLDSYNQHVMLANKAFYLNSMVKIIIEAILGQRELIGTS
jgi:hypothetical protein